MCVITPKPDFLFLLGAIRFHPGGEGAVCLRRQSHVEAEGKAQRKVQRKGKGQEMTGNDQCHMGLWRRGASTEMQKDLHLSCPFQEVKQLGWE